MKNMLKKIILEEILKVLKEEELPPYDDTYAKQEPPDSDTRIRKADVRAIYGRKQDENYRQKAIQHVTDRSIFHNTLTPDVVKLILNGEPEHLADYIISQVKGSGPDHMQAYIYESGMNQLERRITDSLEKANRYALAGERSGFSKQQAMENQKQAYTLARRFASRVTISPKDFEVFLTRNDKYDRVGRELRRIMELAKTGIMTTDGGMKMGLPTTGKFNPDGTEKVSPLQEKKLTKPQAKKKEKFVMGMKSAKKDFEKRYPGRGEEVMYATATKMAKKKKKKEED